MPEIPPPKPADAIRAARETRRIVPHDLYDLQFVGDPQPAPDGSRVAYVVTTADAETGGKYTSRIWIVPTDGSTPPCPLTTGTAKDTAPRWSPDGTRIAFLSTRAEDTAHLFVLDLRGGDPRQLTVGCEAVSAPTWSPDGTHIAIVRHIGGALAPPKEADETEKDAWANRVRTITAAKYREDGSGFRDGGYDHVCVVSADSATADDKPVQLTHGDWDNTSPAWSPDGTRIAFKSYREPDRDANFRSDIWVVAATGGEARKVTRSAGQASAPAWSPDSTTIAYFGHDAGDAWAACSRVWAVDAEGGTPPCCLTPALDRRVSDGATLHDQPIPATTNAPLWTTDGRHVRFIVADGGNQHVYRASLDGSEVALVAGGERVILAVRSLPDDRLVLLATSPAQPAELFVSANGEERQLTETNAAFLARKDARLAERFTVQGSDDHVIDCWLLTPPGFDPAQQYPLVLEIHGGPQAQYGNAFSHEFQTWANAGYLVLYTNPHGSVGYGEAFTEALRLYFGEQDMPDVTAAVDAVIARGCVDTRRLGATGGSYGGFMVNWLVGHTDRFAAAITQRCISNWVSDYGSSDYSAIAAQQEFGGPPWEQMETYVRLSPLTYAGNIVTPLLIEHQEGDMRCAVEQAEQLYSACKRRGVPVEFVRYPNESHGMSRTGQPRHRTDRLERHLAWFARYLNA